MQKIKQVEFTIEGYFYSNYNYSDKFTFTLEVSDIKALKQAVEEIRQELANQCGGNYRDLLDQRNELEREVEELVSKMVVAKANWEGTKQFLETQGIKADAPDFPDFGNYLLPSSQQEVDAEFENDDEEE